MALKSKWTDTINSSMKDGHSVVRKEKEAQKALDNCCIAMQNISQQLVDTDYTQTMPCDKCGRKGLDPSEGAKAMGYLSKVVNDVTRLLEFAKGNADQRAEIKGVDELLKFLTHEQFKTVCGWIQEREQFQQAKQLN